MTREFAMEESCRAEVLDLHRFFEEWFQGECPPTELARLTDALAVDFELITPGGVALGVEELVRGLKAGHARHTGADPPFEIEIADLRVRPVGDDLAVAVYEERQTGPSGANQRLSSALLRRQDDTPNGVEWVHLHEVWLTPGGEVGPA